MFLLTSCGIQPSDNNKTNQKVKDPISAFSGIVKNNIKFISAEDGKYYYLKNFTSTNFLMLDNDNKNEYTTGCSPDDYTFDKFCLFDIDSDGNPELLLDSPPGFFLLFRYDDGIIHEYTLVLKELQNLKTDTTFVITGGAVTNFVGTIKFSDDKVIYSELCAYDKIVNEYQINGKDVSEEEAYNFLLNQEKKENVEWYDYNESNLAKYLSVTKT